MEKKLNKNNNSSSKQLSLYFGILFELEKVNYIIKENKPFNPLLNLLKGVEDIKNILKSYPQNILNFLYFNMDNIERILYNEDEVIYFEYDINKKFYLKINQDKIEIEVKNEMAFLFYISLLIKYNKNKVNCSFSYSFINKINSLNKINASNLYKNILTSKIILELINSYKSNLIFEEKSNKKIIKNLNKIEKENIEIIKHFLKIFENLGLKITQKELKLKNIDLIYAKIINIILKSKDYNLINKLDLENINITKIMFNEISKTLSSDIIYEYRLTTFYDLYDSKIIDFYYILFKYILKNSIYIYYIDFLNQIRKTIIKTIHLDLSDYQRRLDSNFKDKITYIIKFFTNSDYYVEYISAQGRLLFDPLHNLINNTFREQENSFNLFQREESILSHQNDNNNFSNDSFNLSQNEEIILNNPNDDNNFLNYSEFSHILDITERILDYSLINLRINNSKENAIEYEKIECDIFIISYSRFKIFFSEFQEYGFELDNFNKYSILFKNYKKLIEFLEKIKEIIKEKFAIINKLKLFIKIKLKEDKTRNNDNSIKYIISEYYVENSFFLDKQYQDKNILNINNYEGFTLFLKEIVDLYQNMIYNNDIDQSGMSHISSIEEKSNNKSFSISNDIDDFIFNYNIHLFIRFIKVIEKHTKIAEKIKEMDNGNFISEGYNEISIYNNFFDKIDKYNFENYNSFFIGEKEVIISQKNKLAFLNNINTKFKNINFSFRSLLKIKDNKYIICNENGLYYCMNGLEDFRTSFMLNNLSFRGGIKITDEIIAFTSNRIHSKGENKIIFLNITLKRILIEIEVNYYSFTLSENNCALMKIPKDKNYKLLLFACKKYIQDDKNGILLLKLKLNDDNNKKLEKFYDTKNFEVYCFCQISIIRDKKFFENNDKTQANETDYFLVGGFDLRQREGLIKLYQIIYDDEFGNIEIEYIQDIIIEKKIEKEDSKCFKGFKGPISCIIQSSTGEILVTCYDGNVYLFSKPNFKSLNQNYNIFK